MLKTQIQNEYKNNYLKNVILSKETLKLLKENLNNKEILYSLNKNIAYAYAKIGNHDAAYNHILLAHELFTENATKNNQIFAMASGLSFSLGSFNHLSLVRNSQA